MKKRRVLICLLFATALWLPCLRWVFRPAADPSAEIHGLLQTQLAVWSSPADLARERQRMRDANAEWDFMSRTYFALSLANLALREPEHADRYLQVLDTIIDETIDLERKHGQLFFMMNYGREGRFRHEEGRSIFEDGEIALMLAARRFVREKDAYRAPLAERIAAMERAMRDSPTLCAESYPNECWAFCNSVALAAMKVADAVDGTDHRALCRDWVQRARERLVDERSGLLISSFTRDGHRQDGPEGSGIWMVAHCLQLVDPDFAGDQYARARRLLGRSVLGFGYAAEWPSSDPAHTDIDSGPIVPLLDASASSSGLALIGAAAFGDAAYLRSLRAALNAGGFPQRTKGGLRYCAGNQLGDAVLLYALVQGPLWQRVLAHDQARKESP